MGVPGCFPGSIPFSIHHPKPSCRRLLNLYNTQRNITLKENTTSSQLGKILRLGEKVSKEGEQHTQGNKVSDPEVSLLETNMPYTCAP